MSDNKPDLTKILAALSAYHGKQITVENIEPDNGIQDLLVDLENLSAATGARFDTYASHVHYLAEQGLCMGCASNPEAAEEEGEDWSWGSCAGSHELEGQCKHEFDDISEASVRWINAGLAEGYSVKTTYGVKHPNDDRFTSQNHVEPDLSWMV